MAFKNGIVFLSQLIADTLTGALIQTAATGARWIISAPSAVDTITGWSGTGEAQPARIRAGAFGLIPPFHPHLTINGPAWNAGDTPMSIDMQGGATGPQGILGGGGPWLVESPLQLENASLSADSNSPATFDGGVTIGLAHGTQIKAVQIITNVHGNAVTNASGQQTFNHTLGVVPMTAIPIPRNSFYNVFFVSATNTQVTLEWGTVAGGPVVGSNPIIDLVVIA